MNMIERILSPENLSAAVKNLRQKPDSSSYDGMRLSQLREYLELNRAAFVDSIMKDRFRPGYAQEATLVSPTGKARTIAKLTSLDRLVLRAIFQVLSDEYNDTFSKSSFGYRPNVGVVDAAKRAVEIIQSGERYAASIDIQDFFDKIPHGKLKTVLSKRGVDKVTTRLIGRFLACEFLRDGEIVRKKSGVLQGSPLSPLLSNLYLHEADVYFEKRGWPFCRYGDDIRVFAKTMREASARFRSAKAFLEKELGLKVSTSKSWIGLATERVYLGYRFYETGSGQIEIRREDRSNKQFSHYWRTSSLRKVGSNFHIVADGVLTQKDYALLFENPKKKIRLPVRETESLNLYSNVVFSSGFFRLVSDNKVVVNIFDGANEYLGAFVPNRLGASGSLTLQQATAYVDESRRLELARRFAVAAAHNLRENLKYYARHIEKASLKKTIAKITREMTKERAATSIEALLLVEGRVREAYYSQFDELLFTDDFTFGKRTRRPPRNPLNSLLSYGNTILYRRIAREVYKSRLDIRFGYLHATTSRYESLNLDVAELFRPVVVERVIFALVNKRALNATRDFEERKDGAVYLNASGKKIFINALEEKLSTHLRQKNGASLTYMELIREELRKLTRYFESGEEYKPYKYFL